MNYDLVIYKLYCQVKIDKMMELDEVNRKGQNARNKNFED